HLLGLCAVLLLHCFDLVISRRETFQLERTIVSGHGEERMVNHIDPRLHPRVLVALYRYTHFRTAERLQNGIGLRRLGHVPLAVHLWHRMNVVSGVVTRYHLEGLTCLDSEDMRLVDAAMLIDRDRLVRNGKRLSFQSALHVDEHVAESAIAVCHYH